ncbi:lamin tail domain-containing protein [Anaerolineales bacterium HSG24]|nr:lamin tail domain-containing protein [Anaerolineales bacterium HSG24]
MTTFTRVFRPVLIAIFLIPVIMLPVLSAQAIEQPNNQPVSEAHAIGSWQTESFTTYIPIVLKNYSPNHTATPTQEPVITVTTTPVVASQIRITHVDPISEYVDIKNETASDVEMIGWTLYDEANNTYTFVTFTLKSQAMVRVWVISGTNDAENLYWGRKSNVWNDGGDTATLADAEGKEIHQYSYPVATPTPESTTTAEPSETNTPTPTATPIVITSTIPITIVNVQFTPSEEEHVQIQNTGPSELDMTGWTLEDEGKYKFIFPDFTLQPGATVKVWVITGTNDTENLYSGLKSSVWNDGGDVATLRDDTGVVVAVYVYPTDSPTPTPAGSPTATPTSYPVGSSPITASVRVTYIEYNPDGDDLEGEYVRVKNFGEFDVDMMGWSLCDEKNSCYKFLTFTLQSQATVAVWVKEGADTTQDVYWGNSRSVWNNGGDSALLKNASSDLIHRCTYSGGDVGVDCEAILE